MVPVVRTKKRRADSKLRWSAEQWSEWAIELGLPLDKLLDYKAKYLQEAGSRLLHRNNIGLINDARNKPCVDCGLLLHKVMEFDHVRGRKEFSINAGAHKVSELVLVEIAKCDIRCPNCHRARHYWMTHRDDPYYIDHPPPPLWKEYV